LPKGKLAAFAAAKNTAEATALTCGTSGLYQAGAITQNRKINEHCLSILTIWKRDKL